MAGQYVCQAPGRVDALRDAAQRSPPRLINGILFLEVAAGHGGWKCTSSTRSTSCRAHRSRWPTSRSSAACA